MHLTTAQLAMACLAALLVGFSKTGMPGAGTLVVPLLAAAVGGRLSIGTMLPMLIFGDLFAIVWYRRHALWGNLARLAPWVVVGIAAGSGFLKVVGDHQGSKDVMNLVIGWTVLVMLGIHVARLRWGSAMELHNSLSTAAAGVAAGFTTTASNAAGPVMSLYLQSMGLSKEQFMGTQAWFFFAVNVTKLPIFIALSAMNPSNPIINNRSLTIDAVLCPVILIGVFIGKWCLPRIPQKLFDTIVLVLAAVASVKLILG